MNIPHFLLLSLLTTSLNAQAPATNPASPPDSTSIPISTPAVADTTAPDSLLRQTLLKPDTIAFRMPATAFAIESARASEFLFQDLTQLFSNTLPAIPIVTGEVGQPRYLANGELPARVIATLVDSVHWIPGVYGTVDLTSLPEAGADRIRFMDLPPLTLMAGVASASTRVTGDSVSFVQPLTRVRYTSGPYGADATSIAFSRALSRRLTGAIYITFSNSDGQFATLPYAGHKARLRFDYRLRRLWRLSYRHFNTRNEAGIGEPFFPEEWPDLVGGFHKEERLYHALQLAPSRRYFIRAFYWQVKEELNDPARQIRHRLRDTGAELHWHWQRERAAVAVHARAGEEQVQSTSILPASREYANVAAVLASRPVGRLWLQGEAQYLTKANWPAGHVVSLAGLWQFRSDFNFWVQARQQRIPPALAERDNQLVYLASNQQLRSVDLLHFESGVDWRHGTLAAQAQIGGGDWREGFTLVADSAAGPAYLLNSAEREPSSAVRLQVHWQPSNMLALRFLLAHSLQKSPDQFWFWYQPEAFARLHLEARRTFFKNNLEVLPRLSVRYWGERSSPVFAADSVLPQSQTFTPASAVDFLVRLRYGSGALFLSWENLFDNDFLLRAGVPDPGLAFRWGFQWTFYD